MKRTLILVTLLLGAASVTQAQNTSAIAEGARLWAANCTRCHNARSPAERTDRQWVTVVNHMRARANMTRAEAKAIVAYLQAVNLPPSVAVRGSIKLKPISAHGADTESRAKAGPRQRALATLTAPPLSMR